MTVRSNELEAAIYVVDSSGIVPDIQRRLRKSRRGRKAAHDTVRLYLIGAVLCVMKHNELSVNGIEKVLIGELEETQQWRVGVMVAVTNDDGTVVVSRLSKGVLYKLNRAIALALDWTLEAKLAGCELSDSDRSEREAFVFDICQRLIATTHIVDHTSGQYAIDGSGLWAWKLGSRAGKNGAITKLTPKELAKYQDLDEAQREEFIEELKLTHGEDLDVQDLVEIKEPSLNHDPDAKWGVATAKVGGKQPFFGFEAHAIVRVPERHPDECKAKNAAEAKRLELRRMPPLAEAVWVTPASTDIVDPTLRIIDHVRSEVATGVSEVFIDRHYSYKAKERWADELRARKIDQHLDLHTNDHGHSLEHGFRMIAGHPFCPRMPDDLVDIRHPGVGAKPEQKQAFIDRIEDRSVWAARVHQRYDNGSMRVTCPAAAHQIGCATRDALDGLKGQRSTSVQIARDFGDPIVLDPPDPNPKTVPLLCRTQTVTVPAEAFGKIKQPLLWGSAEWVATYGLRTFVEGFFGVLKNNKVSGVCREQHHFTRLARVNLMMALSTVVTNITLLRNWHEQTGLGDETHPLLNPTPPVIGFREIDLTEKAEIAANVLGVDAERISFPILESEFSDYEQRIGGNQHQDN